MKKILPVFFLLLLLCALFVCGCSEPQKEDFLRVHIRADSNDPADQKVKLKVRDAVVEYLTPLLKDLPDVETAKRVVAERLERLTAIANDVLRAYGFSYSAKVGIRRERFPTKTYGDVTLLAGVYDAIVFELGSGKGDNWWCVAYPSLCFGGDEVTYRSKIKELIDERSNYGKED